MIVDEKVMRRLIAILRLGGSEQIHEADSALRKAVLMMEEHGITVDALLDRIGRDALPQTVCAELARRYCLSRLDKGPSAREDYYRAVFLRIARLYQLEENVEAGEKPPTDNVPRPASEKTKRAYERQDDTGARPDWKSRMDEDRRRAQEASPRATPERENSPPPPRYSSDKDFGRSFFAEIIRNPAQTIRLFLVCCLYGLPRGFIACIILAGGLQKADIHTYDSISWIHALSIAMFPFMVWKARRLVRSGWFS